MGERPERLGEFRITGILGEGGGGIVYAAIGPEGEVALKVPRADRELTDRDRERYLAEAAMMERVRHPAIVEVLAAGVLPDGRPYVAMPRLAGRTLAEKVFEDGPLGVAEALTLFDQLADATTALHGADLLHRDLKAENVFLLETAAPRVKLLDFGIAKDRSAPTSHTTTGMVRGTPATMAPERFFGAAASEQSDVYELAVVLYVMLAGRLPWAGDETDVRARAHPVPLHAVRPEVPLALSQRLMAALATRPEHRPTTPRALADQLAAVATQPAPAPLAGPTVTSPHLRELLVHETPFDAAVASRPDPVVRPARWRAPAAIAAIVALAAGAALWAPGAPPLVNAGLASAGVRSAAGAALTRAASADPGSPPASSSDGAVPDSAVPDGAVPDGAASDGHDVSTGAGARSSAGVPGEPGSRDAAAPPSVARADGRRPTPPVASPPPKPPVVAPTPASTIPGGVYDTPPY